MPGETLLKSPETARLPSFSCRLGGQAFGLCKTVPRPFPPPYAKRMARLGQSMPNFSYANVQGDGQPIAPKSRENCKSATRCPVFSGHLAGYGRVSHSFTDYPNVSACKHHRCNSHRSAGLRRGTPSSRIKPRHFRRAGRSSRNARRSGPVSVQQHLAAQRALNDARPVALTGWKLQISGSLR
jgi:hypothetical protein